MAINLDLDFRKLSIDAIKTVDSIRSRGRFGNIIPAESRVNALYRAIGLPSVVKPEEGEAQEAQSQQQNQNSQDNVNRESKRDPNNTANIFPNDELPFQDFEADLRNRENIARTNIDEEVVNSALYFFQGNFSDSLAEEGRIGARLPLKPFVVFGEVEIFPQNRRVGGAFLSDEQLQIGDARYNRPLIETIVLLRLKGEGVNNTSTQTNTSSLSSLFEILLLNINDALDTVPGLVVQTLEDLQSSQQETKQIVKNTNVPDQHPETQVRNDSEEDLGTLDRKDRDLQLRNAVKSSILDLLEFDDTFGEGTTNLKAGLLASETLLGTATIEPAGAREVEERSTEERKVAASSTIKGSSQFLDLAFGIYTGISGVDVLAIILALLSMSTSELIGLLNEGAKGRLREIKGDNAVQGGNVKQSLDKLEELVRQILARLDELLADTEAEIPID